VGKERAEDQNYSLLTFGLEGNAIVDQNGIGRGSRGGQQQLVAGNPDSWGLACRIDQREEKRKARGPNPPSTENAKKQTGFGSHAGR
jgi:hypothetical protein